MESDENAVLRAESISSLESLTLEIGKVGLGGNGSIVGVSSSYGKRECLEDKRCRAYKS